MKNIKLPIIATIMFMTFVTFNANAETGKQKPPGTDSASAQTWYEPVLDLLSLN